MGFDLKNEIFEVYVAFLTSDSNIHPFNRAWIMLVKAKKALTLFLSKYIDFIDMFSANIIAQLLKHIGSHNYMIKLIKDQILLYQPIYTLKLVKLNILKILIKINITIGFLKPSKSLINAIMLFEKKSDSYF